MTILLDRPHRCPVCQQKVRQLYPLTRRDPKSGKWVNGKACLVCCGPVADEPTTIGSQFAARPLQR